MDITVTQDGARGLVGHHRARAAPPSRSWRTLRLVGWDIDPSDVA